MTSLEIAYEEARKAYLREHPPPTVDQFECPYCKAPPGRMCRRKVTGFVLERYHIVRQDRRERANRRRLAEADKAGEAAARKADLARSGWM